MGIGTKFFDFIAKYYFDQGLKFYCRNTHIRLYNHCKNCGKYITTGSNGKAFERSPGGNLFKHMILNRVAYSVKYVGEDYFKKEHKDIVVDDDKTITEEDLLLLKEKYYVTIITGRHFKLNNLEKLCLKHGIPTEILYKNEKGVEIKKNYPQNDEDILKYLKPFEIIPEGVNDLW